MIWWPFIEKYEFSPEWNKKIQLTKNLYVKYSVTVSGFQKPKMIFEIWIDDNHYQIQKILPYSMQKSLEQVGASIKILHVLCITRSKKNISFEINGEKRNIYLKTPLFWKVKTLK